MLRGELIIIENVFGFERLLVVCDNKEVLVNNDYLLQRVAIIAFKNIVNSHVLTLPDNSRFESYSFEEYYLFNKKMIDGTINYIKEKNIKLSWLQILQVSDLIKEMHVDDAIEDIVELYNMITYSKNIDDYGDKKEINYLDF